MKQLVDILVILSFQIIVFFVNIWPTSLLKPILARNLRKPSNSFIASFLMRRVSWTFYILTSNFPIQSYYLGLAYKVFYYNIFQNYLSSLRWILLLGLREPYFWLICMLDHNYARQQQLSNHKNNYLKKILIKQRKSPCC